MTLDGETVDLAALRLADAAEGALLENLVTLMRGTGADIDDVTDLQTATVGGKQLVAWTDSDGERNYVYETGDILFTVDGVTEAQAETIFWALP